MDNHPEIPKWPHRFFKWYCSADRYEELHGDLEEYFYQRCKAQSIGVARRHYLWDVIRCCQPYAWKSQEVTYNPSIHMLKNYVLVAIRNLKRNKLHSSINIIGLAVGMVCSILITLFVQFELSFDRSNRNADRIYRLVVDLEANDWAISAFPLGGLLQDNFPEVETFTRIKPVEPFLLNESTNVKIKQKVFFVDSTVLDVLDIQMLKGNPTTVLSNKNSILLTPDRARAFFGSEDPIGKSLIWDNGEQYEVTGIFEPLPANSHVHIDAMVPSLNYGPMNSDYENPWNFLTNHYTYLIMTEPIDHDEFGRRISIYLDEYHEVSEDEPGNIIKLQPLTSIHLHSNRGLEIEANGNINTIYIFSAIAFFILLIACINFMNLSTAQSLKRAKEVGIRKVAGCKKNQLVFQFLSESVVVSLVALAIAIVLLILLVPEFNELSGKQLIMNPLENLNVIYIFLGVTLFAGIFAGLYPAFFLSSFQPATVIKGTYGGDLGGQLLRQGLVVLQFAIAFVIIVSTYVVYSQLDYMLHKNMGFDREQTLMVNMPDDSLGYESVKNEFLQLSGVEAASFMLESPGKMVRTSGIWYEGAETNEAINVYLFSGDDDLIETMGMSMEQGEYFQKGTQQFYREFVVNEKAVEYFGWKPEEAVGKLMNFGNRGEDPGRVIGVVKDFHFKHLHEEVDPLVMYLEPSYEGALLALKLNTADMSNTVELIKARWAEILPQHEFEYSFLDESFDALFDQEKRLGQIFGVFALLAVFISCLGLFGLTSFTIEQRKKSVAVRKVLGATVAGIVGLVSKDFLKLVIVGMVIAAPIAYYAMNSWLSGFAYNVGFQWLVFIYAALASIFVAFITISYHSLKAATSNPVKSLREQ
ncbi:MAG: FtsX-like permease family protein [Bacteroidota bacterium]